MCLQIVLLYFVLVSILHGSGFVVGVVFLFVGFVVGACGLLVFDCGLVCLDCCCLLVCGFGF